MTDRAVSGHCACPVIRHAGRRAPRSIPRVRGGVRVGVRVRVRVGVRVRARVQAETNTDVWVHLTIKRPRVPVALTQESRVGLLLRSGQGLESSWHVLP